MTSAQIIWITPDAEQIMGYCARVSNPANQDNQEVARLLRYCINNRHWSVFEMASMCVQIDTTRDIARQILRHRSLHFQEFSQRYADASLLGDMVERECRLQDDKNRQNSVPATSEVLRAAWSESQKEVWEKAKRSYSQALAAGIAKEQARALLPEGLTPSRMYASGTIRDWIHYCDVRCDSSTQSEHRDVANAVRDILVAQVPAVASAMWPEKN